MAPVRTAERLYRLGSLVAPVAPGTTGATQDDVDLLAAWWQEFAE